ncbi:MAG: helix-turn-helix transcriptional regulator [Prevotellaceae bacterium]|jgi:DNA-binding CsgD family transcriptional regulator|nr:helix-turn-helix transcriptional regulator [Prevotellaceae bacterium]
MMKINAALTPRECQIAELLAWGAAKKEVADRLHISTRTVENIAKNIYEKINIQKATELSVWWFCTRCGVSFSISPIKRVLISSILLLFFAGGEVIGNSNIKLFQRNRIAASDVRMSNRAKRRDDFY